MSVGTDFLPLAGKATAWIGLVGEAAARGTLLLLAALFISLALRRGSAASRHMVWASCLCLLLMLPLLAQIAPVVPAPVIPPSWSAAWSEVAAIASSRVAGLMGDSAPSWHSTATASLTGPVGPDGAEALAATTMQFAVVLDEARPEWGAAAWLAAVWAAGTLLVLCWLAVGLWLRSSLSRRAHVVHDGPWVDAARGIAAQLGIKRDLVLLRGEEEAVPMTWGGLRPVIYLPPGSDDWAADQRRSVLLHELAHVRRWDSLTRSVSQLACAIFWFHPLAWYAAHRLLREQERACDDMVLLAGAEPDAYATTLLTLARRYRRRRLAVVGALALARRSKLENRLISILDPRRKRISMSKTHRFILLATFVAVVIPLASLQPAPAEPAPDTPQPGIELVGSQEVATSSEQESGSASREEAAPIQMIIKGVVHMGSSLDEIEVEPGGRFVIQEILSVDEHLELESADPEYGRRLEITADAEGNVDRVWTVDGATRRIDDEARVWVKRILGRLDDAHVEFSPGSSDETRTLIFAGESLAMVGEAHLSAGSAAHGVVAVTEGDRVLHLEPGMVWTIEEGEEGRKIELHLSEPHVLGEGKTIDLHLAKPLELGEGGEWTIHVHDPELLLHKEGLGESIVLELKKAEDDESFTVVVEPKIIIEPEIVAEARIRPRVLVELAEGHEHDPMTIVVERSDDERHRHSVRIRSRTDDGVDIELSTRGEVELGDTIDELEVGEGGELTIDARDTDGVVRQLSVRPGPDGELLYEFHVDGEERPFDDAARVWLQEILRRIEG